MAKVYYEKLSNILTELDIKREVAKPMEVKHFFSGAALYVNQSICVTWSPVGLAFKLPGKEADKLISSGKALPLKYFLKGHVKKGYALFENPDDENLQQLRRFFLKAVEQV